ncbi:MAG: BON domain-containing protein [Leptospiraceae bacterium]|nr:BON domain-containing protein [Leptospiraceae bacterium]
MKRAGFLALSLTLTLSTLVCSVGDVVLQELDDRSITTQIIGLLIQDLSINHLDIKVITDEGEVYLIGRVDTFEQRLLAEQHARSVSNVWSVINLLETNAEQPYDQGLREADLAIQTRLFTEMTTSGQIPFVSLAVHAFEGQIFLIGRVRSAQTRRKLLDLVHGIDDVRQVHDYLKIGSRL